MTDRELLELAARAAGHEWRNDIAEYRNERGLLGLWIDGFGTNWSPLEKDGDALSLAVDLGMIVYTAACAVTALMDDDTERTFTEEPGCDPCAATRRAITRAAAEIGKAMK